MFIKEIALNNFRIYKGYNRISLSPIEDKNIILISGKNGFGKTTFLMSLIWCLYGKQMSKVDELYAKEIKAKGNYTKYIESSLNRKAKEEGINEFSVSIIFEDVRIHNTSSNEVQVTRTYNSMTASSDTLDVTLNGCRPDQLIDYLDKDNNGQGEELFIREFILPIEIAKFFLFDAEKIVSLAEVNPTVDQHRDLSKAYSQVLVIQKYEDLKDLLEEKQDEYRKKFASPQEIMRLNDLIAKIDNLEIQIKELEEQNEDNKDEKYQKQKALEDIQIRLIRNGGTMTLDQLEELRNELKSLEDQKEGLKNKLKDLVELIPFAFSGEVLMLVNEQLKKESLLTEQKYRQDYVNSKIVKIHQEIEDSKEELDFSIDLQTSDFYNKQIAYLIKKYFIDTLELSETLKVLHDFPNTERREFEQLISTLQHSFRNTFSKLHLEYSLVHSSISSINRKIRDAEKSAEDEIIADLRKRKDILHKEIVSLENDIETNNIKIGQIQNEVNAQKGFQESLRGKIDEASKYTKKEKKTKELIIKLKEFISKFQEMKKHSLEDNMLKKLNQLLHKQGFIKRVGVDICSDDIDIRLYNDMDKVIDKASLSMGERQMYASALLNALVDESDIEFPVFIDSPMQKFDEQHAGNIITYFYPNVSKQVVLFPLINKELTESEYLKLQKNVCRTYLIDNISTDRSRFLEVKPEEFIETYNDKYNAN